MLNILSLRYYKLKQQDTTTHILKWIKSKKLTVTNADENMEQKEPSLLGEHKMVQPP